VGGENHTILYLVGIVILLILIPVAATADVVPIAMLPFFRADRANQLFGGGEGEGQYGGVSAEVPAPMAAVFNEIGNQVGVPPALLAAFSSVECGRLWNASEESLTSWINNNEDPGHSGCCFNNGFNCWGPAQFLYSTWGLRNPGEAPRGIPRSGSYGDLAAKYVIAPPFMCNIREAIYAMASKIKRDSGGATNWTDDVIEKAAQSYCGSCDNPTACPNYCNNIITRYHKYVESL
jgi:hypothetical protein